MTFFYAKNNSNLSNIFSLKNVNVGTKKKKAESENSVNPGYVSSSTKVEENKIEI